MGITIMTTIASILHEYVVRSERGERTIDIVLLFDVSHFGDITEISNKMVFENKLPMGVDVFTFLAHMHNLKRSIRIGSRPFMGSPVHYPK